MVSRNSAILDHDSYAELRQLWRFGQSDVERALRRPDNPLGRMNREEASALAGAARRAETLSEELQKLVWEKLVDEW